jgi:hypothetical protein
MNYNWEVLDLSDNLDYLHLENNDINIEYNNNESQINMDFSDNCMSIQLNNLDQKSIKLSYIEIESDSDDLKTLKTLKIGDINFRFGTTIISYPSLLFNITKTNNGYKIDLSNLVDLGLGNIITKLFIYNVLKLGIKYEGNINKAVLYYYKALDSKLFINLIKDKTLLDIKNINCLEVKSNSDTISANLIFDLISDNLELYLLDGDWKDYEKIGLFIDDNIYEKYNLEFINNKCIIKFNYPIHFSKIEEFNLKIKFKNLENRNLIILNKFNNKLQVSNGSSYGFRWSAGGFINKLIDINKISKFNIDNIDDICYKLSNLELSELDYNYL